MSELIHRLWSCLNLKFSSILFLHVCCQVSLAQGISGLGMPINHAVISFMQKNPFFKTSTDQHFKHAQKV